jgi:hypothetical protein
MHDFMRKALKLAWFRIGWLCQVGRQPATLMCSKHASYL